MAEASKVSVRKVARYGWVPDIPDNRDFMFRKVYRIPAALPSSVDLRSKCSPVEDQGQLGSCTANALVGALEFLILKNKKPYADMSRLFIYYNERVIEHTVNQDSGAMIRDGIKTLNKQGACRKRSGLTTSNNLRRSPRRRATRRL